MLPPRSTLVAGALALLLLWAPSGRAFDETTPRAKNPSRDDPPEIAGGWVVVPGADLHQLIDEADDHFMRARQDAEDGRWPAAGHEIARSSFFLRLESGRGLKPERAALRAMAARLDSLDAGCGTTRPPGTVELAAAFAEAHRVLARHHLALTRADWTAHDAAGAGEELEATLLHEAQYVHWLGAPLSVADQSILDSATRLVSALEDSAAPPDSNVEPVLRDLDRLIPGRPAAPR